MSQSRAGTTVEQRRRRPPAQGDVIQGVMMFDATGLLVHADPLVAALLARIPGTIVRRIGDAARDLLADPSAEPHREQEHAMGRGKMLRVRLLRSGECAFGLVALKTALSAYLEVVALEADLTPRELDVARQVVAGQSDVNIGERLGITTQTVRWHVRNILRKTGLPGRPSLVELII